MDLPVCVVDKSVGLTRLHSQSPSEDGDQRGDEPQVIVTFDEPTVATKSSTSAGEGQEFKLVPRLYESRFLPAAGQFVPGQRVSTEDSVDFANLCRGDISKLLSELKGVNHLVPVLPLNHILPLREGGDSQLREVISGGAVVHLEEDVVFADSCVPCVQERSLLG